MTNNVITRRQNLCAKIHGDLADMIIDTMGMQDEFMIPIIVDGRGDAVALANYLRGVGYTINLVEMNRDFLFELYVTWK